MTKYFPSSLNVFDRDCLVVGNDREAKEKTARLKQAGARVSVVPVEKFKLSRLKSQFLVVFSDRKNPALAKKIYQRCRKKRILLCAVDLPVYCDVINASIFQKGHLNIAISTNGASPGIARKIRQGLEKSFESVPIDRCLNRLARLRGTLEKKYRDPDIRREHLLRSVDGFEFKARIKLPR